MNLPSVVRSSLETVWAGAKAGDVEGLRLDFKQDGRGVKESYRIALDAVEQPLDLTIKIPDDAIPGRSSSSKIARE